MVCVRVCVRQDDGRAAGAAAGLHGRGGGGGIVRHQRRASRLHHMDHVDQHRHPDDHQHQLVHHNLTRLPVHRLQLLYCAIVRLNGAARSSCILSLRFCPSVGCCVEPTSNDASCNIYANCVTNISWTNCMNCTICQQAMQTVPSGLFC